VAARARLRNIVCVGIAATLCAACAQTGEQTDWTHDGLEHVPGTNVDRVWIKPGADFSGYTAVQLLDCTVSFTRSWKMNHPELRSRDLKEIEQWLSDEFRTIFTEALEAGGFPVVSEPDDHVLGIRPSIIDLRISAPDTSKSARSRSYTTVAGSMTLVLELYDSISNEILARALDRRQSRNVGGIRWTNRVTNVAAAREILKRWANLLVAKLDQVEGKPEPAS